MSKRNSHRNGSFGGRQSERKKKLRQFGQEALEIHLERPPFPPAIPERPVGNPIENITTTLTSNIAHTEAVFRSEITSDGTLSYQPNKPGNAESR